MSAETAPTVSSDESHFTPEHVADAAYRKARGRSWEFIAHELKHPNPDRLRRTMEKDAAFQQALKNAKRAFRDEAEADSISLLQAQLYHSEPAIASAAAKAILEFTTKQVEREAKVYIEETRAKVKLETEATRAEAKTGKAKRPDLSPISPELVEAVLAPAGNVLLWGQETDFHGRGPDDADVPMRLLSTVADGTKYYYVVPLAPLVPPPGGWMA
jgi:hypothetical protein